MKKDNISDFVKDSKAHVEHHKFLDKEVKKLDKEVHVLKEHEHPYWSNSHKHK
jgi:hypothetical protein